MLRIYNRKSLVVEGNRAFGWRATELQSLVIAMAREESDDQMKSAVKKYFGRFNQAAVQTALMTSVANQ